MNFIHKYYQLEELRYVNLSNNNNEITPYQIKIQDEQKKLRSQLADEVSKEMIRFFNFSIDQGLLLIDTDKLSNISQLEMVDLNEYYYLIEQLKSEEIDEIIQVSVCDKIMDEIDSLKNENFYFTQDHYKLFKNGSFPQKLYQQFLEAEENEYEVDFDQFIDKYQVKKQILLKLQKTSIFQLEENLITLEEKIPHLAQHQLEKIINYKGQDDVSAQLEENKDALLIDQNQLIKTQKDISFIEEAQLPQLAQELDSSLGSINDHKIQHLLDTTYDQESTDEEENDYQKQPLNFDKRYKIQLTEKIITPKFKKKTPQTLLKILVRCQVTNLSYLIKNSKSNLIPVRFIQDQVRSLTQQCKTIRSQQESTMKYQTTSTQQLLLLVNENLLLKLTKQLDFKSIRKIKPLQRSSTKG